MLPPTLSNEARVVWNGQPCYWKGLACHQTPDDLWNFAEMIWQESPATVLEVGTGEGGTSTFLRSLFPHRVLSVDQGDHVPPVSQAFVILDGDVYNEAAIRADLITYASKALWLAVCHTNRPDWGAATALGAWLPQHPEWTSLDVRHPTQHTWLIRR